MTSNFETIFDNAFDNVVGLYHIANGADKTAFQKLVSVLMSLKQCLLILEQGQHVERVERDVPGLLKLARTQLEQLQSCVKQNEYDKIMGHFSQLEQLAEQRTVRTR